MFVLTKIRDIIKVEPQDLKQDYNTAVQNEINRKYSNRVVHEIGLCISLFDIVEQDVAHLYHSDGCSYLKITFRLIVFRPFISEIIVGKVKSMTKEGIMVSLGFFDDIIIPTSMFQKNTIFDETKQMFIWHSDWGELEVYKGDPIRFRVESEAFVDNRNLPDSKNPTDNPNPTPPFQLFGSIAEDGLGMMEWWG